MFFKNKIKMEIISGEKFEKFLGFPQLIPQRDDILFLLFRQNEQHGLLFFSKAGGEGSRIFIRLIIWKNHIAAISSKGAILVSLKPK